MEVETHLQIELRLKYIEVSSVQELLSRSAEVGRMLNGLMQALARKLTTDR